MSQALARSWMVLLVGGPGCGKTRLARLGARLAGRTLIELPLTSGTDTSDLLGRQTIVSIPNLQVKASTCHSCTHSCMQSRACFRRTLVSIPNLQVKASTYHSCTCLCSFEQVEPGRRVQEAARQVASLVSACSQHLLAVGARASSSSDGALAAVLRQCKALQVRG
eukprot:scaffold30989_cov21-Tisochrysis_lutea.AAC.1